MGMGMGMGMGTAQEKGWATARKATGRAVHLATGLRRATQLGGGKARRRCRWQRRPSPPGCLLPAAPYRLQPEQRQVKCRL